MDPSRLSHPERPQQDTDQQRVELTARLETAEHNLVRLHNTLHGVAREADVSIGCPCDQCDRSYLLVTDGQLICPHCGYQQSI